MKISLNWLKEYVDLPAGMTMPCLADALTMRTVEVESVTDVAAALDNVVCGKILQVEAHPAADRLKVVRCDVGGEEAVQIVCGGSNLAAGQWVAVALPGALVRWHGVGDVVEIKKSKLRGVPSEGMICASPELDLEALFPCPEETIIMDLSDFADCVAGKPLAELLGMNDQILEIDNKSMTHRPDLWGHYGIARELAAMFRLELKPLPSFTDWNEQASFELEVVSGQDCPRYTAAIYDKVDERPSPFWMRQRLHLLGIRPINLLVDLSNYVMLALGEPTHAFDRELVGDKIVVRRAREAEKLTLLDERELLLSGEDLLIAASEKAVGLAGVMGGKMDSVGGSTQTIILEAACFNKQLIRQTSKRYGIRTEAASRFEKGIDSARALQAQALFRVLLGRLMPESRLIAFADREDEATEAAVVRLEESYLRKRLGRSMSSRELEEILAPLGFRCEEEGRADKLSWLVTAPLWRSTGDISEAADLVEELARMIGYENFAYLAPAIELREAVFDPIPSLERRIREYFAFQAGMREIFSYPWIEDAILEISGDDRHKMLKLATPPSPQMSCLRSSLVPGLLQAALLNERFYHDFAIFELTQVFSRHGDSSQEGARILQERELAAAIYGDEPWKIFLRLKGILEDLPRRCAAEPFHFAPSTKAAWADKNCCLGIFNGEDEEIGRLALLSKQAGRELGLKRGELALCQLNLEKIQPLPSRSNHYRSLPHFPQVEQDLSLLMDEDIRWSDIRALIQDRVESLEFVEEYRGRQVPAGKKSLLLRLLLGKKDGTLTSAEIEEQMQAICKKLSKKLKAEIRQ